jgi:hypothetical protein
MIHSFDPLHEVHCGQSRMRSLSIVSKKLCQAHPVGNPNCEACSSELSHYDKVNQQINQNGHPALKLIDEMNKSLSSVDATSLSNDQLNEQVAFVFAI